MPLKTKRWNDPRKKSDGFRILVCRYRPRALKKEDETWDAWWKELGPSAELHAILYGKTEQEISWAEFSQRYTDEMKGKQAQEMIAVLAEKVAADKTITLLCSKSCTKAAHCHRSLLKALIEAQLPGANAKPTEAVFVPEAIG